MKAFWWFKDNSIAGMARPGFNGVRWFDLPFDETLIFGWIGQRSCGVQPIQSLKQHFLEYGSKIKSFHEVDDTSFRRLCDDFEKPGRIAEVFQKVADRTKCIEHFEVSGDQISFQLSSSRLATEIEFLKQNKIGSVVTLTEQHNQQAELSQHFDLLHLAIDDLNAPQFEQAIELAKVIKEAKSGQHAVAVHCMAGIGRTSTMLMASHLILGEKLDSLLAQLENRNPTFKFTGPQADFVRSVADRVEKGQVSI